MPHNQYYPVQYTQTKVTRFVPRAALAMGGVGAIIGGTTAAARNIKRVKEGEIQREEAVRESLKEAAGTGLAATAATALVGAVSPSGWVSLAFAVVAATGTKYLWDSACRTEPEEKPKKLPSKGQKDAKK